MSTSCAQPDACSRWHQGAKCLGELRLMQTLSTWSRLHHQTQLWAFALLQATVGSDDTTITVIFT